MKSKTDEDSFVQSCAGLQKHENLDLIRTNNIM